MKPTRIEWDGSDPDSIVAAIRKGVAPPVDLVDGVARIIAAIRERGDDAVAEFAAQFDGVTEAQDSFRVPADQVLRARDSLPPALIEALDLAATNLRAVADAELERGNVSVRLAQGQDIEIVDRPVAAAAIYAPGGRAAYPSSVLMGAIPARAAGVARLVLATPPDREGGVGALTLAAASIAGVDEVYAIGGAQAIAALAIGTATLPPVDLVAGPGNAWVTEAKRQLFGEVGIDGLAGPSELAIVLDGAASCDQVVLDLLAQAEHGEDSPLVAISADGEVLDRIAEAFPVARSERPSVAAAPLTLVQAPSLSAALKLADALAPEHLELRLEGADSALAAERVAGCVFVGSGGATAFGDYVVGSNHVLPTAGRAAFSGPLGARTFMRRTSVVSLGNESAAALAPAVEAIAQAEGLPVHGESASHRAE